MSGRTRLAPLPMWSLVVTLTIVVAACGTTPPTPTLGPQASASPSPATSGPAPASPPAPSASASPPASPPSVTVDPGLLEVLPTEIDGVALEPDPTTAAEVASDPLLAESALSIAVALAIAPGSSESEDLAVASVIRLRPDVFDEAFYQEWRDTYNEAACEVADGVESETQAEIAGRSTYVGTCVGGAKAYHVFLEDQGFIVSITTIGARHFGELILAGIAG